MEEPSVLDYLKSRLNPRSGQKIAIPTTSESSSGDQTGLPTPPSDGEPTPAVSRGPLPWRSLLALILGLAGQALLEPPAESKMIALGLYVAAAVLLIWAWAVSEWALAEIPDATPVEDPGTYRRNWLLACIPLAIGAFLAFSGGDFNGVNLMLWLAAMAVYVYGLWLRDPQLPPVRQQIADFFRRPSWSITFSRWTLLVIVVAAVVIFFRVYDIKGTPAEPFSDHAEKLYDVYDVTQGQWHVFFPRNTGREFFQMYLTAFVAWLFGTGLTFLSLKIGTVASGIFTLPYVYLLGKEIANRRVALLALFLAGTAYWLNVISRVGLRFPLYPLFAAPVLYYIIRGLRSHQRNDFILAGLFLGLGLNGYSPYRFMPFVVLAAFLIYLLHNRSSQIRNQSLFMFLIVALAALLVFIPLFRYTLEHPDQVFYRSLTRLSTTEQPYPGNPVNIFFSNTFNAMLMMNVNDGEAWVHSIPGRPALDMVAAAFFIFGYLLVILRYFRKRNWVDLFLILAVPLLMMTSILSLAFPNENPSLNRTGAAAIPVFIIVALAMDGLYEAVKRYSTPVIGKTLAVLLLGTLLAWSASNNFDLTFNQYSSMFRQNAWNSTEIGDVIRAFIASGNSDQNAWVVAYPYWVDTRNVAIEAGYVRDMGKWPEDLPSTLSVPGNKLFILKDEDMADLETLKQMYPIHSASLHESPLQGKSFWVFFVPASQ